MKNLIYLVLAVMLFSCNNQQNNPNLFTELKGEYLGQQIPEDSALLFAPGIVSTGMAERDIVIYPDGTEIYFCRNTSNFKFATIFYVKLIDGSWTKPEVAEFATDPKYIFIEPHISPDGKKFFFASNKQAEGDKPGSMEIWVADREENGWGEPYNIGAPVNTESDQYFPSVTEDGTLYFTSEDSATNEEFIYRSKLIDGKYQTPELLPKNINMGRARFNTLISPKEDFIIVPAFGMPDSYGATDYYIVFRDENDNWSNPMNMSKAVNSVNGQEWSASLSPDGKYMFFMSAFVPENRQLPERMTSETFYNISNNPQNGNSDIYWVKSDFIKDLRTKAVFN